MLHLGASFCHEIQSEAGEERRFPHASGPTAGESTIEYYPSGSVVARVLLTANPSVYTPVHKAIAHCGGEKEMIEPHPLV